MLSVGLHVAFRHFRYGIDSKVLKQRGNTSVAQADFALKSRIISMSMMDDQPKEPLHKSATRVILE